MPSCRRWRYTLRQLRQDEAATRWSAKAAELGYDSIEMLVRATKQLPGWELAELLDVHQNTAYRRAVLGGSQAQRP